MECGIWSISYSFSYPFFTVYELFVTISAMYSMRYSLQNCLFLSIAMVTRFFITNQAAKGLMLKMV